MIPHVYDMSTDSDRPATQDDVDRLQRTARAFGELAKRIKFYVAEARNGLVLPGMALSEIAKSLEIAERTSQSLNLDEAMQHGPVHGRHVLVVER